MDIRDAETQNIFRNNLCIVRAYHHECSNTSDIHLLVSQVVCQYSDVGIMSMSERENANKILLLQFIQKGFSISQEELVQIQS